MAQQFPPPPKIGTSIVERLLRELRSCSLLRAMLLLVLLRLLLVRNAVLLDVFICGFVRVVVPMLSVPVFTAILRSLLLLCCMRARVPALVLSDVEIPVLSDVEILLSLMPILMRPFLRLRSCFLLLFSW